MGTIRLTELGSEPTMAVKLVAVLSVLSSVAAEASLGYYGPGVAHHGYGATSYVARSPQGAHGYYHGLHHFGKRSAEPSYGYHYGPAIANHGYGGSSYVARSTQGIGKRSAEPGYGYHYGGYSHQHVSRPYSHYGLNVHHGIGKRSAEPSFGYHYGPAVAHHGYGATSYVARSPQGARGYHHYGKRSAEPSYGYYHGGYSHQHVSRPYSHYGVSVHHY